MESLLVRKCIEAATESPAAVEKWMRQRRTLERMPSHLAEPLLRTLQRRRLLFPSLLEVFKFSIEEVDLRSESCVDAEWMAYLGAFQYLRSLILADCHKINNSAVWSIAGMKYLKELDISRCSKVTDSGIRHLLSVPSLEKLYISETGVTADGVKALASLTNLSVLDLGGLPVTDSALSSLQVLKKLQHLDIWGSSVSDKGADVLTIFPNLSKLNLGWTGITNLPNLPSITRLNMSHCTIHSLFKGEGHRPCMEKLILAGATITNDSEAFQYLETSRLCFLDLSSCFLESFTFLDHMNSLTHLNLSETAVVDDTIEHIVYIGANLRYLNLSNTRVSSSGVATLAGHFPNLESLLLSHTCIDDTAIIYISMMPSLKVLDLSWTRMKGMIHQEDNAPYDVPSFSALQSLTHLERLELEEILIDDASLIPLTSLGELSYLSLQHASFTDSSLHHLLSAPKLNHLTFRNAVLTDSGLKNFIPPPTMKVLDLGGCWLLTKDALMHFCSKHPQIDVRHEFVELFEKQDVQHKRKSPSKHKQSNRLSMSPVQSDERFLDQRLKYSRQELLALQSAFTGFSTSTSTEEGILGP